MGNVSGYGEDLALIDEIGGHDVTPHQASSDVTYLAAELIYESDFSSGVDGWTETRATAAGNIDSIGGEDNWLRITIDTTNNSHFILSDSMIDTGKSYNVSLKYFIPSTNSHMDGVRVELGNSGADGEDLEATDASTTHNEAIISTGDFVSIRGLDGGNEVINDTGGDDVFYVKEIRVVELPV